jgi:hypothetical protein
MDQNKVIDSDHKCPWIKQNLEKVETTLPVLNYNAKAVEVCEECPNAAVTMSWFKLQLDGVSHPINGSV